MNPFQRQPLIASLAVVAAVLVAAIGIETGFGTRLGARIPSGVSKPAVPFQARLLPAPAPLDPEQTFVEMVARPLFTPTRRPAPAAEAPSQVTFKRGQYVLQGVIIAAGTKIAMLRDKTTGKVHRVQEGHDLEGMKVAEVKPDSVTLGVGKEHEVLPLEVQKQAAPGVAKAEGPFGAGGAGAHNPLAPGAHPTQPPSAHPGAAGNGHAAAAPPQATTAPLTPEELLARRRARRNQQNQ
jgi:hypothetical protein